MAQAVNGRRPRILLFFGRDLQWQRDALQAFGKDFVDGGVATVRWPALDEFMHFRAD
jgi:hypothetical protein